MSKTSKGLRVALLAVATACSVAPAHAETANGDSYQCHFLKTMGDPGSLIKSFLDGVASIEQCFALCNGTPGCVAVQWGEGMTVGNQKIPPSCKLFNSAKSMSGSAPEPADGTFGVVTSTVCVKKTLKYKPDVPDTVMQIPQIPTSRGVDLQNRHRPGPQPGPGPSPGRRR